MERTPAAYVWQDSSTLTWSYTCANIVDCSHARDGLLYIVQYPLYSNCDYAKHIAIRDGFRISKSVQDWTDHPVGKDQ